MKENRDFGIIKEKKPKKVKEEEPFKAEPFKWEPWHLSTATLLLDVIILAIYLFAPLTRIPLLVIGYGGVLLGGVFVVITYLWLYHPKVKHTMQVNRFTGLINSVALFITLAIFFLTLLFT